MATFMQFRVIRDKLRLFAGFLTQSASTNTIARDTRNSMLRYANLLQNIIDTEAWGTPEALRLLNNARRVLRQDASLDLRSGLDFTNLENAVGRADPAVPAAAAQPNEENEDEVDGNMQEEDEQPDAPTGGRMYGAGYFIRAMPAPTVVRR
jgi:hypothetical protein